MLSLIQIVRGDTRPTLCHHAPPAVHTPPHLKEAEVPNSGASAHQRCSPESASVLCRAWRTTRPLCAPLDLDEEARICRPSSHRPLTVVRLCGGSRSESSLHPKGNMLALAHHRIAVVPPAMPHLRPCRVVPPATPSCIPPCHHPPRHRRCAVPRSAPISILTTSRHRKK